MASITGVDIQSMVQHWLNTPVNGYLGSDYGSDLKSLLHNPQRFGIADGFIAKLKRDVPVLQSFPINLYSVPRDVDKLDIVIEVAGIAITVN